MIDYKEYIDDLFNEEDSYPKVVCCESTVVPLYIFETLHVEVGHEGHNDGFLNNTMLYAVVYKGLTYLSVYSSNRETFHLIDEDDLNLYGQMPSFNLDTLLSQWEEKRKVKEKSNNEPMENEPVEMETQLLKNLVSLLHEGKALNIQRKGEKFLIDIKDC